MNKWLAVLFLLACATGCKKRIDFGPKGEVTDARALLVLVRQAADRVGSIQGDAKLTVHSPQGSGTLGLYVAAQRPDSIHLESLDFFGKPIAVLVSKGGRFGLYQGQENRYYEGPASPANVSRFLPVVLPPTELVSLLLGQAPLLEDPNPHLRLDRDEGVYEEMLQAPPVTQTLSVEPKSFRVTKSQVAGGRGYDLAFEDFGDYGPIVFPRKITLTAAAADTELTLRYQEVTLNAPVDEALFTPSPPEGVPVVEVDASGNPVSPTGPPSP